NDRAKQEKFILEHMLAGDSIGKGGRLAGRINNTHITLGLPSEIQLGARVDNDNKEPDTIVAYTGKSVDLSDYGIDHPVVYNTAGISYKKTVPYLLNHWKPIGHVDNIKLENGKLTGKGHYSYPGETSTE